MKQELLDDLQRLLKCPKPKTECADRALLDGALSGWKDEAYDLKRELNNGDPTDAKWLERPIKVELLPRGLGSLCLDNFGQYAQKYYNAAITFRRLMYTLTIMRSPTLQTKTETPTSLRCARWRRYGCRSKKGVAKDSNSRMIKITNRLADSGLAKVEFREVTPCELCDTYDYGT